MSKLLNKNMGRKVFLKGLGLGVVAGSSWLVSCHSNEGDLEESCNYTGSDDLGPFFVSGTNNVVNLNTRSLPGTPMIVTGKVYSGEGSQTPLSNVKIEIWHADSDGVYHPEGDGSVSRYSTEQVTLRGFVLTDSQGEYTFQSIWPGLYGSRARHIHYKLTASNHQELVTQSYFKGDPRIASDGLSQNAGDCRIVSFRTDAQGRQEGEMDFNLRKS